MEEWEEMNYVGSVVVALIMAGCTLGGIGAGPPPPVSYEKADFTAFLEGDVIPSRR